MQKALFFYPLACSLPSFSSSFFLLALLPCRRPCSLNFRLEAFFCPSSFFFLCFCHAEGFVLYLLSCSLPSFSSSFFLPSCAFAMQKALLLALKLAAFFYPSSFSSYLLPFS
jgi:hypothetical protein